MSAERLTTWNGFLPPGGSGTRELPANSNRKPKPRGPQVRGAPPQREAAAWLGKEILGQVFIATHALP